jgi:hypothetical protein
MAFATTSSGAAVGLCAAGASQPAVNTSRREVFAYLLATDPDGACPRNGIMEAPAALGAPAVFLGEDGVAMAAGTYRTVPPAQQVVVCSPIEVAAPPPVVVSGVSCAGAPVPVTVNQVVQSVPHPTAVQLVKVCASDTPLDREVTLLCAPAGAQVWVVTQWPQGALPGTPPTIDAFNLDGTPYTGAVSALTRCATNDYEVVSQAVCVGGVSYTRTTFFDAQTLLDVGVVWQDTAGAVVPAPTGVAVLGACSTVTPVKVAFMTLDLSQPYLGEGPLPVQTVDGGTLVTMLGGGVTLLSVTAKQVKGTGILRGALILSPLTQLRTGESISWSSHGTDQEDGLDTAFSIDAGVGGRTTLTILYRA